MFTAEFTARFWSNVDRGSESECWLWRRYKRSTGYGTLMHRRRLLYAHRVSWQLANGADIPKGMVVMHACDTPACVNPKHLKIGTHAENVRDAARKDRIRFGSRHHGTKLNNEIVAELRRCHAQGESAGQLSKRLGISRGTINAALSGRTWRRAS